MEMAETMLWQLQRQRRLNLTTELRQPQVRSAFGRPRQVVG